MKLLLVVFIVTGTPGHALFKLSKVYVTEAIQKQQVAQLGTFSTMLQEENSFGFLSISAECIIGILAFPTISKTLVSGVGTRTLDLLRRSLHPT